MKSKNRHRLIPYNKINILNNMIIIKNELTYAIAKMAIYLVIKVFDENNKCFMGSLQVWSKICNDILHSYVVHNIYHPIIFRQLFNVLGFGIFVFNFVQWNLYSHFRIRYEVIFNE